jgi:mRNA-degrading endonuclease YafQ of YafQ-DinJ toxin-antitoxin module
LSTWAKVISKNFTKIANQKIKAQTTKLNETIQWKSRQMIMFSKNFVNEINSSECRDRMNKRLKDEKIDILITMINLSRTENNIIFIISKKNIANQLIQCRSIWESEFSIKSIQEDEIWFDRIVHDVEISRYDNSMSEFQKEIETYNELKFARESIWLTRVEKRENKTHTSVKISLKFKNDVDKTIKNELIVNEKALQVTEFLNNRINQCHKCQEFKHLINTCRETNAKCRLCAKNHDIRMHMCLICKSTKSCSHIFSKCANCDKAHVANDSNCEHFRVIEIKSKKSNQLAILWMTQLFKKLNFYNIIVQDLQTQWSRV